MQGSENMRSIITAAVLVLALGLLLYACNKGGSDQQASSPANAAASGAATPAAAPAALDGAAIYAKANCAMCHAENRGGKPQAPSLLTLKQTWTVGELAKYLKDPQGFAAGDSRLSAQKQQYTMKMPAPNISDDERRMLAQWLLGQ
jgi:cytochrome c5